MLLLYTQEFNIKIIVKIEKFYVIEHIRNFFLSYFFILFFQFSLSF